MKNKIGVIKSILFSKFTNQPYKLNFAITSACNSRCKTCNVWQVFRDNPKIIKDDLSLEEIKLIFKSLPKNFVWLSLSGGEPFLRKDLVEICKLATKYIPNLGLISIPSNGLLTDRVVRGVKKVLCLKSLENLFLNFSLDGPEKIHDTIRGIKGGYRKTWKTYSEILKLAKINRKLHVNLETTISKYNLDYLEDFFPNLVKEGYKITVTIAHTGYLYKNTGGENDFTKLNHDGLKLTRIIKIVQKSLSLTSPVDLIERIYLDKILTFYQNSQKQPLFCTALQSSIALDSKGNITPCFMWGKILGNIRNFDYDFQKFFKEQSPELNKIKRLVKIEKCPNCWTPCEAYQTIINQLLGGKLFFR